MLWYHVLRAWFSRKSVALGQQKHSSAAWALAAQPGIAFLTINKYYGAKYRSQRHYRDVLCTHGQSLCASIQGDAKDTKCVFVTQQLGNNNKVEGWVAGWERFSRNAKSRLNTTWSVDFDIDLWALDFNQKVWSLQSMFCRCVSNGSINCRKMSDIQGHGGKLGQHMLLLKLATKS